MAERWPPQEPAAKVEAETTSSSLVDSDLAEEIDLYCRLIAAVGQRRLTAVEVDQVLGVLNSPPLALRDLEHAPHVEHRSEREVSPGDAD